MDKNMRDLVSTVNELLINITSRIDDISNRYKNEGIFEENRVINLVEDIEALAEGISVVHQQFSNINILELNDKLSYMTEALENKDASLFIDTILYELKPFFEYWSGILMKE